MKHNNINMYFKVIERKSVVVEQFSKVLKNKVYKYMAAVSRKNYVNKLPEILEK